MGGLDTAAAPSKTPITHLTQLDNAIYSTRHTWKKRGGLVEQNTTPMSGTNNVTYMVDYWKANSGNAIRDMVAVSGTHLYKDDGDNTWDDVSGTVSFNSDPAITTAVVGDSLVIASGTIPYVYAQTGNMGALSGTPPTGNLVTEHLGRAWMNDSSDPHFLSYTGLEADGDGNPTYWSTANGGGGFYVEPNDGDPAGITALFTHQDYLYVAKKTKIYRIEGRTAQTFRPVRVVDGIGVISQNMVVSVGGDAFFPSLEGFHSLAVVSSGNLDPKAYLSARIHNMYHNDLNKARFAHAHGVYLPSLRAVIWTVPLRGQSTNMIALVYFIETGEWARWTNFKGNALATKYNTTNEELELWTAGDMGDAYKYTPTTLRDYATSPIEMVLRSGQIYPSGNFIDQFGFKYHNLLLQPSGNHQADFTYKVLGVVDSNSSPVSVTKTINQGPSSALALLGISFTLGVSQLGSDSFVEPHSLELVGSGKAYQWSLTNNVLDQDLEVVGWYLEVDKEGKVRNRVT